LSFRGWAGGRSSCADGSAVRAAPPLREEVVAQGRERLGHVLGRLTVNPCAVAVEVALVDQDDDLGDLLPEGARGRHARTEPSTWSR
jgi:hypothetical protein